MSFDPLKYRIETVKLCNTGLKHKQPIYVRLVESVIEDLQRELAVAEAEIDSLKNQLVELGKDKLKP
jgi:hypothetical protein